MRMLLLKNGFSYTVPGGVMNMDIAIQNAKFGGVGNDLAIDDIEFKELLTGGEKPNTIDDYANIPYGSANYAIDVLANDRAGFTSGSLITASMTLSSLPDANEGSVSISSNGEFLFTPATGFMGTSSFTYVICHSSGCCSEAVVTVDNVLPVRIHGFRGHRTEGAVELSWSLNEKSDDGYFEVQRSSDGKTFLPIGRVEGAAASYSSQPFQFIDHNPVNHAFYQIKWVDINGNITLSDVIEISAEYEVSFWFEAFPNSTKGILNLMWQADLQADVNLVLYHIDGRVVARKSWAASAGPVATSWQLPLLADGLYLIRASHAGRTIDQKIWIR